MGRSPHVLMSWLAIDFRAGRSCFRLTLSTWGPVHLCYGIMREVSPRCLRRLRGEMVSEPTLFAVGLIDFRRVFACRAHRTKCGAADRATARKVTTATRLASLVYSNSVRIAKQGRTTLDLRGIRSLLDARLTVVGWWAVKRAVTARTNSASRQDSRASANHSADRFFQLTTTRPQPPQATQSTLHSSDRLPQISRWCVLRSSHRFPCCSVGGCFGGVVERARTSTRPLERGKANKRLAGLLIGSQKKKQVLAEDLLNPSPAAEARKHKLKVRSNLLVSRPPSLPSTAG